MSRTIRKRAAAQTAAPVFSALGDEVRLQIVLRLSDSGPLSIARLTEGTRVTRQAISKHLRVLEDAGLACSAREGRESVWQLQRQRLDDAQRWLDGISAQWDAALGRLKDFVEK